MLVPDCLRTTSVTAGLAVEPRQAARLDEAVLDRADVAERDRAALRRADDEVAEVLGALDAAHRAQDELLLALIDAAAGHLEVLRADRRLHLLDRQAVGGQPVGVERRC